MKPCPKHESRRRQQNLVGKRTYFSVVHPDNTVIIINETNQKMYQSSSTKFCDFHSNTYEQLRYYIDLLHRNIWYSTGFSNFMPRYSDDVDRRLTACVPAVLCVCLAVAVGRHTLSESNTACSMAGDDLPRVDAHAPVDL